MEITYSYRKFFERIWKEESRENTFSAASREEAEKWQKNFRETLKERLGLGKLAKYAEELQEEEKRPHLLEKTVCRGYIRYQYAMETLPDVFLSFYVLEPMKTDGRAMIVLPGHGADKNTLCAVAETEEEAAKIQKSPEECYGETMALAGYLVFCPDPPGMGKRLETISGKKGSLACSCSDLAELAEAFGLTFQGLFLWDLQRLADFAESWRGFRKLGCMGFSGGGQYAMWLSAMDERISATVISGYLHSYGDSLLECHRCACNFFPGLWKLCDISDLCALIAPRPLYGENGQSDPLNGKRGIAGPEEQMEKIRLAYQIFGAKSNVWYRTPKGGHQWYGECMEFLEQFMK
jgi:hypothetical protein